MPYDPFASVMSAAEELEQEQQDRAGSVLARAQAPDAAKAAQAAKPVVAQPPLSPMAADALKNSQHLMNWMQRDGGKNADLVGDDLDNVGKLAWLLRAGPEAYRDGAVLEEYGKLATSAFMNPEGLSVEERARLEELRKQADKVPRTYGAKSGIGRSWIAAWNMAPMTVGSLREGGIGGVAGGTLAAVGAGLLGQLGPQIGTPEELVSVPTAFRFGFLWGSRGGAARYSFLVEAGLAYEELRKMTDENGNPFDEDVMRMAAIAVGGANAGLELVSLGKFVKAFGGAGELILGKITREELKKRMASITFRTAMKNVAKRWTGEVTTETVTEMLQELTVILAGEMAQDYSNEYREGRFETGRQPGVGSSLSAALFEPENRSRLVETGVQTLGAMMWMGLPGVSVGFTHDATMARNAKENSQFMAALGDGIDATKIKDLPEKTRELVAALKEDGPVQKLGVDRNFFAQIAEESGSTPEELARAITGSDEAYRDAVDHGGDVMMDVSDYAAKVASTPLNTLMFPHLRAAQGAMTLAEKIDYIQKIGPEAEKLMREQTELRAQGQEIYKEVFDSLVGEGQTERVAASKAKMFQNFFVVMAKRSGMNVLDLWKKYKVKFSKDMPKRTVMPEEPIGLGVLLQDNERGRHIQRLLRDMPTITAKRAALLGVREKVGLAQAAKRRLDKLAEKRTKEREAGETKLGKTSEQFQQAQSVYDTLKKEVEGAVRQLHRVLSAYQHFDVVSAEPGALPARLARTNIQSPELAKSLDDELERKFQAGVAGNIEELIGTGYLELPLEPTLQTSLGGIHERGRVRVRVQKNRMLLGTDIPELEVPLRRLLEDVEVTETEEWNQVMELRRRYTSTPQFRAWFRNSVIVDAEGRPLMVYHATRSRTDFHEFAKTSDIGYHFGNKAAAEDILAHSAIGPDENIPWQMRAFYLSIQNPVRLPDLGGWWVGSMLENLVKRGYISLEDIGWTMDEIRSLKATNPTFGFARGGAGARATEIITPYDSLKNGIQREHAIEMLCNLTADRWGEMSPSVFDETEIEKLDAAGITEAGISQRAAYRLVIDLLKSKGYDGIVYENSVEGGGDSYIVFETDAQMIKSATDNSGEFSLQDKNFYKQTEDHEIGPTAEMTAEERRQVISTARGWKDTVVYRWARENLRRDEAGKVLDFGSGGDAKHTVILREHGFNADAYDLNYDPFVHVLLKPAEYKTVLASNVLNVQPTMKSLRSTLAQLVFSVSDDGSVIANYTMDPRYLKHKNGKKYTANEIKAIVSEYFGKVELVGGTPSNPIWRLSSPLRNAVPVGQVREPGLSMDTKSYADTVIDKLNKRADADVVPPPGLMAQYDDLPAWSEKLEKAMRDEGFTEAQIAKELNDVKGIMAMLNTLGHAQLILLPKSADVETYEKRYGQGQWGPVRTNSDALYVISFDATAMCVRRMEAAATASYIQAKLKRPLSDGELIALTVAFKQSGKVAPCLYCFVESGRAHAQNMVAKALDSVFDNKEIPKGWGEDAQELVRLARAEIEALGVHRDEVDPSVATDPIVAARPAGIEQVRRLPALHTLLQDRVLAAKGNAPKLYEAYRGQFLEIPKELITLLNGYAGVRFFSNSDFQFEHVIDLIQAVIDLSVRGACAHAYTKVPEFVEIFGGTGMKIQCSIMAERDPVTGEIVEGEQGMSWEQAKAFSEKYPNVGVVIVATDDAVMEWALDQPWIHYILPYHRSGMRGDYTQALGWVDYTHLYKEKWIVPRDYREEKVNDWKLRKEGKGKAAKWVRFEREIISEHATEEEARKAATDKQTVIERKLKRGTVWRVVQDTDLSKHATKEEASKLIEADTRPRFTSYERTTVSKHKTEAEALAAAKPGQKVIDKSTKKYTSWHVVQDKDLAGHRTKAAANAAVNPVIRMWEMDLAREGASDVEAKRRYLAACKKKGVSPAFGKWMNHRNGFKMKKDYARTDNPFRPVEAKFDMDKVMEVLRRYFEGTARYEAKPDIDIAEEMIGVFEAADKAKLDVGVEAITALRERHPVSSRFKLPGLMAQLGSKDEAWITTTEFEEDDIQDRKRQGWGGRRRMYDVHRGNREREGPDTWVERYSNKKDAEARLRRVKQEIETEGILGQAEGASELGDMRGYFWREEETGITHIGEIAGKANMSTFLHESGHFFFEVMADLAELDDAPEQIKKDVATLLKFAGFKTRAELRARMDELRGQLQRGEITQDQYDAQHPHEKLARSFEAYLFEGKVPNAELRGLFQRFAEWLKMVYVKLKEGRFEISDEVRGVFDRMMATDEQIEYFNGVMNKRPIPRSQSEMGMTDAQYKTYLEEFEKAMVEMEDQARIDAMAEASADKREKRRAMSKAIEKEARDEVLSRKIYTALYYLAHGAYPKRESTPATLAKVKRLSIVEALRRFGEERVKKFVEYGVVFAKKNGEEDFDMVAQGLGYMTADEMFKEIEAAQPFDLALAAEVKKRVDAAMGELKPEDIMDSVTGALHGDRWGQVLESEARYLGKVAGRVAPPRSEIRRMIAQRLEQRRFADLSEDEYLRAEQKASKECEKALARGDNIAAFEAKVRQMHAHEMWSVTRQIRQRGFKIFEYLRRMSDDRARARLAKAGQMYIDQVDTLLEKVDLKKETGKGIAHRVALREFVAAMAEQNRDVVIPDELLEEGVKLNWREMTIGQLQGLQDCISNIDHLARLERELRYGQEAKDFEEVVNELIYALRSNVRDAGPRGWDPNTKANRKRFGKILQNLDAELLKVEQLCKWLDGGEADGPWMRYIFNPIAVAQGKEDDLTAKFTTRFMEILERLPKERRNQLEREVTIKSMRQPMTIMGIISIALNCGNASNLDKLMRGGFINEFDKQEMLSRENLEEILSHLQREDWIFVQEIWDMLEDLWPEMEALEKRLTGLPPNRITRERPPMNLPNMPPEVRGGYFPAVYDPKFTGTMRMKEDQSAATGTLFMFGYGRAMTAHGHLNDRVAGYARPMLIDFAPVLTRHMQQAIHDLTHREAVISVYRLLNNNEITNALSRTMGEPYLDSMVDWLKSVANERVMESSRNATWWGRWIGNLRANTTMVAMGFKATTMMAQLAGISSSMEMIGSKWVSVGMYELMRNRNSAVAFVMQSSAEMRHRTKNVERDTREAINRMLGSTKTVSGFKTFAYQGIGYMDMCVSVPTWLGAYRKAVAEGLTHEKAVLEADSVVRLSQGSGAIKDQSAVSRAKALRAFTMFYTYFSALYARSRTWARDVVNEGKDTAHGKIDPGEWAKLLARSWFMWVIPALMSELLAGRPPDEERDEKSIARWSARKIMTYPFLSLPFIRDVASAYDMAFQRGGYRVSPIATAGDRVVRVGMNVFKMFAGEDTDKARLAGDSLEAFSYTVGLPWGQMNATGGYLYDVWNENAEPEEWYDWAYGLVYGRELPTLPPLFEEDEE